MPLIFPNLYGIDAEEADIEAADVQAHGKHNRLLQRDGTIGNGEQSKGYGQAVGEHDGDGERGGDSPVRRQGLRSTAESVRWIKPSILGTSSQFETAPDCDEPTQPLRTAKGKMPWHLPPRAIRTQIEPACAGMLMPKLQTQVSPRLT
jgi:hypothetical protein